MPLAGSSPRLEAESQRTTEFDEIP